MVQPFEQREARFWNCAHISQISGIDKAKSVDLHVSMHHGNAHKLDPANTQSIAQRVKLNLRACGIRSLRRERVIVNLAQDARGVLRRIKRNRAAFAERRETQRAKIIHAEDVIGMPVSIEDCVDTCEFCAQCLLAEIRAGVDYDCTLRSEVRLAPANQYGWTHTPVMRISGSTHFACAAQG